MGIRGASSSFTMGQGFGADLIESDDGALQMRVSGFDEDEDGDENDMDEDEDEEGDDQMDMTGGDDEFADLEEDDDDEEVDADIISAGGGVGDIEDPEGMPASVHRRASISINTLD